VYIFRLELRRVDKVVGEKSRRVRNEWILRLARMKRRLVRRRKKET